MVGFHTKLFHAKDKQREDAYLALAFGIIGSSSFALPVIGSQFWGSRLGTGTRAARGWSDGHFTSHQLFLPDAIAADRRTSASITTTNRLTPYIGTIHRLRKLSPRDFWSPRFRPDRRRVARIHHSGFPHHSLWIRRFRFDRRSVPRELHGALLFQSSWRPLRESDRRRSGWPGLGLRIAAKRSSHGGEEEVGAEIMILNERIVEPRGHFIFLHKKVMRFLQLRRRPDLSSRHRRRLILRNRNIEFGGRWFPDRPLVLAVSHHLAVLP